MEITTGVCEANEVFVRPSIPSSLLTHGCYVEAAAFLLLQYHRLHLSLSIKSSMFQHVLTQVQTMSLVRETVTNFQYQLICQMEQFVAIDVSMKCLREI